MAGGGFDISGSGSSGSSSANTVKFGMMKAERNLSGRSVTEIRNEFGGMWKLPGNAAAFVNHKKVDDSYELQPGDELTFIREAGEKG